MRTCFLALLLITITILFGCGDDAEVVNPVNQTNPQLTQADADLLAKYEKYENAPAAPAIRGGWQNMSCVEFHNGIHEWASIGVEEGAGNQTLMLHIVVHASLVSILPDEDYVMVYTPQGYRALGFEVIETTTNDGTSSNVKFHKTLALAKAEAGTGIQGNPIHLFRCNTTPSDATHIVYQSKQFADDRADKTSFAEVMNGTAEQAVIVLPIGDVNTIFFAQGIVMTGGDINQNSVDSSVVKQVPTSASGDDYAQLKESTRVMFFSSEAEAEAYAIPLRMRRTVFEATGAWYHVALYVKSHGEPTGTVHHGVGDSHNGFERIQYIYDSNFPETDTEKKQFIRSQFTSNAWRTDFDNGNIYFKFAGPFETQQEATGFDHPAAVQATTATNDKLDLRLSFEADLKTAVAQRDEFVSRMIGNSPFANEDIGIYIDSNANNVVKGIMVTSGGASAPSSVTFGGATLTREVRWQFTEGQSSATQVANFKEYFGFTSTWARSNTPTATPTRPDPTPALLVYNPTARTFSVADPLTLYNIADAHQIKWFSSATAAQTAITEIQSGARTYTYFNVTQ